MGDPAGIGPEIILKALQRPEVYTLCRPVIYGDIARMRSVAREMMLTISVFPDDSDTAGPHILLVHQATTTDLSGIRWGELSAAAGSGGSGSGNCGGEIRNAG